MLQNFKQLGHSIGSFALNTTVGILGFLNPAEKLGLKPHKEDVGQTLGSWSPDLVVICSTCFRPYYRKRFQVGLLADTFIDPFAHVTIREHEMFGTSGNSLDYFL